MREHFQFNADIIGESDTAADAELIALLIDTLRSFGLTARDFLIRLSSRNAWQDFYTQRQGDPARAYEFYQAIDKLDPNAPEPSRPKLAALGFSLDEISTFIKEGRPTAELESILKNLAARGLIEFVQVDYHVIRGLAYYTGVVFEAFDRKGELRAIAGGGRYDNLVKLISGNKVDLPALGFGMGDVVLLELLKARQLLPKLDGVLDVFCLIEDEALRADSLRLIQELRAGGCAVDYFFTPAKADKQFKRALESKARNTAKLERAATGELLVRVKHLQTREEKAFNFEEAVAFLNARQKAL
jgi:histidyl-tRNA synthetase